MNFTDYDRSIQYSVPIHYMLLKKIRKEWQLKMKHKPKVMAGHEEDFDIIVDRKYCDDTKEYIHRNIDEIAIVYMTKAYTKAFKNNTRAIMNKVNIRYVIIDNTMPYSNYCGNIEYTIASLKKQAALVYLELSKYIDIEHNEYKAISKFCIDMNMSKGSILFYKLIAENGIVMSNYMTHIDSIVERMFDYCLDDDDTHNTFTLQNSCVARSPFKCEPTNRDQKRKRVKK